MILELVIIIVTIVVTALLVMKAFQTGFQLGNEKYIQPPIDADKVTQIELEEGDPLNG